MTTPTPQARPSAQDVDKVARILMAAWEEAEGKPVTASYVPVWWCSSAPGGTRTTSSAGAATFADMARAALRALPTGDEALAKAWDEGFMAAASQDHPAYPRTRRIENPYLTTPPAQDPSKEADR